MPKEHDRCGSNLIVPMMLLSAGGTVLLERLVEEPEPAARAGVGLGGASLAVEMFAWCDRHHGEPLAEAFHAPGREIQRHWATKEPTPEQLEVGGGGDGGDPPRRAAARTAAGRIDCAAVFGRIDHIGVAVEDIDAAIELYERASRWSSPTARRSSRRGSRRSCSTSATATSSCWRRSAPRRRSASSWPRTAPGLHHVAYAVEDIDAALERLAAAGIKLIDAEPRIGIRDSRVAFLHPRSTGGVLTEIVEPAGGH